MTKRKEQKTPAAGLHLLGGAAECPKCGLEMVASLTFVDKDPPTQGKELWDFAALKKCPACGANFAVATFGEKEDS